MHAFGEAAVAGTIGLGVGFAVNREGGGVLIDQIVRKRGPLAGNQNE